MAVSRISGLAGCLRMIVRHFLMLLLARCFLPPSVNDAPALNAADVGIAMGSGTAVAQQASNLVISDDDFCTIVVAIRHGRAIYANIQKFLLFLLGNNAAQVTLIVLSVSVGFVLPFTPLTILFLNLATDGLASVALSVEHGEPELMTCQPRKKKEPLLAGPRLVMLGLHAIMLTCGMVLAYLLALWWETGHIFIADLHIDDGTKITQLNNCRRFVGLNEWSSILTDSQCRDGIARARTVLFILICFSEIARGYTVRSFLRPFWSGMFNNATMTIGSVISLGLTLFVIFTPGVRTLFGLSHSVPYFGWLISIGLAVLVTAADESLKSRLKADHLEQRRWRMMESSFSALRNELGAISHRLGGMDLTLQATKNHVFTSLVAAVAAIVPPPAKRVEE